MIFSTVIRAHGRGFQVDPADLERIGVFDQSVCWGVWVPDPRGTDDHPTTRKHLLVSPIHPSVWPFLLRLEVKLRETPGSMSSAAQALVKERLNIQFAESAVSGHHHATWNVVADAIDVRANLHREFMAVQQMRDKEKVYTNPDLKIFSNLIAEHMFAKEVAIPKSIIAAHRDDESYRPQALDCGFLHNRIVDKTEFFYDPLAMPTPELVAVAKQGRPQAVTCRWMKNLAFFSVYGDMSNPLRLQYDQSAGLLKLPHFNRLDVTLERQRTTLPAHALASFDTSELYLRIDIIDGEVWSRHLESTVDYRVTFASDVEGKDDSASGLWLSICEKVAEKKVDLVTISNRTTDREQTMERGSLTLIGKANQPITGDFTADLDGALRQSKPDTKVHSCKITPLTNRFRSKVIFLSRRTNMPWQDQIISELKSIASDWGMILDDANNRLGKTIDDEVEMGVTECDGMLQIVSYSNEEVDRLKRESGVVPDLKWLVHEYGMAIGAGKPHVRVFDTTHRIVEHWRTLVPIRANEVAGEYEMDKGGADLRTRFEPAFAALAQQIAGRRQEGTSRRRYR